MLEINFSKQAEKFLKNLQKKDQQTAKQVIIKITALASNPKATSSIALVNHAEFRRIRIGKYRIIYQFDEKVLFITIIDKRDEVYKNFH